jgi:hypothetical protein
MVCGCLRKLCGTDVNEEVVVASKLLLRNFWMNVFICSHWKSATTIFLIFWGAKWVPLIFLVRS